MREEVIRCLLLAYLIYEKKWLEIKPISQIDKSPCEGLNYLYVVDLDQLKIKRKVSISGEKLKQLSSCDALLIESSGKLVFIEFKSLKKLIEHAVNLESAVENIKDFNLKNKVEESFLIVREVLTRFDKGSFLEYAKRYNGVADLKIEEVWGSFSFKKLTFLIVSEDEENLLNELLWPELAIKAIFGQFKYLVQDIHNNLAINCDIEHATCSSLVGLDFSLMKRLKERNCNGHQT